MWFFASRKFRLERRAARAVGLKNYAAAAGALEELLELVGENPHTLHAIAFCHQRLGETDASLAAAQRAIAADPEHPGCLRLLTEVHAARGEVDAARGYALRAIETMAASGRSSGSDREWMRWARALLETSPNGD